MHFTWGGGGGGGQGWGDDCMQTFPRNKICTSKNIK